MAKWLSSSRVEHLGVFHCTTMLQAAVLAAYRAHDCSAEAAVTCLEYKEGVLRVWTTIDAALDVYVMQ